MESSVKLLRIEIDNKLNFEKHISNTCKKASNQLNAICKLQTFMGQKKKNEVITNTFVHSNLITAVLFGTSVLKSPTIMWKKFMKEV